MIDPKNYVVDVDTRVIVEEVAPADVSYHGEPLTNERVDEIVERVHRNLVPGGKSLSGDGKHSPVVQVRVAEQTKTELTARANARGISVSKYTRELIEKAPQEAS